MERREVEIRKEREIGDEGIFVREVIKIIRVYKKKEELIKSKFDFYTLLAYSYV
jgi:hypothetical protein